MAAGKSVMSDKMPGEKTGLYDAWRGVSSLSEQTV